MKSEKEVSVTLYLTKEEADWLHYIMQNPITSNNPHEEPPEDRSMRQKLFEATEIR